ncbi:carboxylating nicotinate-nucleotide diphosphorylase [Candidatus Bathyarchaeota archaeon]|nr:carboxylating nicotinate-nucleotide diphosphorylase [Candidatus Bathyarchaeota archaeon]
MFLPNKIIEEKLLKMLAEDVGQGDVSTALVVPEGSTAEAMIVAKNSGVAAGIEEAKILLESLGVKVKALVADGDNVENGQTLLKAFGDARTILAAERTLLNLLSRMSGIATMTRRLDEKLQKARLKVRVACTRKTAPGLSYFDKKAVLVGGGETHRLHLDDMILIKDNHFAFAGDVEKTVRKARSAASFSKKIEVEVSTVEDALSAARAGADIVMFDNFSPEQIRKACTLIKKKRLYGKTLLEASGGITEDNILEFASTGVNIVSLGEITNSVKALDVCLDVKNPHKK